ncbi:Cob(I)yrinic acid a,c-diamide adenosyltransferase [BD1-7 clade bacterium]|uniref:Corrinoid adenosyltransferase n=1 Tax=BD1-7 clade bacterium TaxID=2029982 RepID=A0A5S9Q8Z6_9GAMM|nr:Cob(I)yrinic acid a,c-diamide adenosyltransferase [BD1-7 clade bacterium]CAA0114480.1 Cob(I)yrinic acid a,c-diamide adenosyltransferase [BD1-7 clade bacterium]
MRRPVGVSAHIFSEEVLLMSQSSEDKKSAKHKASMKKQKEKVDASIDAADIERGVVILLTGDGKGKSSSAFGMVLRALGYGYKVGITQFIKGEQLSGEEIFIKEKHPEVSFYQMGTGFTWNTQDRSGDIEAAKRTWDFAQRQLENPDLHLVVLDEITYMLAYKYLDEQAVLDAIRNRPPEQSVVLTGRGGGSAIRELADTVSEINDVKHAFRAGVKARRGVDY